MIIIGPSKVDILPIPKKATFEGELLPEKMPLRAKDLWSTITFVKYHYLNLVSLFNAILEMTISKLRMSSINLSTYYKRLSEIFEQFEHELIVV